MGATLEYKGDLEFLRAAAAVESDPQLTLPSWCLDFLMIGWLQRVHTL